MGNENWYDTDEPVMLSSLEHYDYCPRQCALIHREQTFDENIYTLRGRELHESLQEEPVEMVGDVRIERELPLWSEHLGLIGRADVVEFHDGVPFPIEYKYGPVRSGKHADLQLCGQALCLEEMSGRAVSRGAIYHFSSRRRREVNINTSLRQRTLAVIEAVRKLMNEPELPTPVNDRRCRNCSLSDSCLPAAIANTRKLALLQHALFVVDNVT
ncbi:MAG: CRISPR-associated protein Cas4 [Dehalococcoidia bacterium]|nr:CRISPR-associated protein Cas4 [Dehalococcoidia bacterium]